MVFYGYRVSSEPNGEHWNETMKKYLAGKVIWTSEKNPHRIFGWYWKEKDLELVYTTENLFFKKNDGKRKKVLVLESYCNSSFKTTMELEGENIDCYNEDYMARSVDNFRIEDSNIENYFV